MTFVSNTFLIFLFTVVILYYAVPLRFRWLVLLAASIVFYMLSGPAEIVFILAASFITWLAGRGMERVYEKQKALLMEQGLISVQKKQIKQGGKKKCRHILVIAVLVLLAVLIYCKIGKRVLAAVCQAFSLEQTDWMQIVIPLGISYYTFSMIGYLCDIYWKKGKAENNYFRFLMFAIYFPKILQGPISNYKNLGPRLRAEHTFDYDKICYGFQLMIWGYFKKMVVADRLAIFVSEVFNNCYQYTGLIFVIAAMLGSIQLYCDFSGCMDIAGGISQVFGIELEKNFDHPFFARDAAEFWRRWHITLGAWFKDYVYMPLLVSPKLMKLSRFIKKFFGERVAKAVRIIIPLGIVWILTGLWHGTGYNYLAWGMYWGFIIIISSVFEPEIKKLTSVLKINETAGSWKVFQMVRTFLLFTFGRLLTLPGHLRTTWDIIKRICSKFDIWILFDGSLYTHGLNQKNFTLAILSCVTVWSVSMLQVRGSVRDRIANCNLLIRWAIFYMAIFSVIIFGVYGKGFDNTVFTYMQY